MKIKKGVILQGLQIEMRPVLKQADKIWTSLGQELVITSGLDGVHSAGSLHYYGYALDFRTNYFSDIEKQKAYNMLMDWKKSNNFYFNMETDEYDYSRSYDIILHKTHMHVEYDRKLPSTPNLYNSIS